MKKSKLASTLKRARKTEGAHVDLHMHSTFSDGALDVEDLIRYCHSQGLTAMSITDHDNIDSYEEGREIAEMLGIEFIPGVELSSSFEGSDIHILGYFFDHTNLRLNQTLAELQQKREVRAQTIVEKLNAIGMQISYEKVLKKSGGGSIGRAHIASILVEEEYVSNFQDAFRLYLGSDRDLMSGLTPQKLSPEEAIQLILHAGGIPVMAHPAKTNRDDIIEMMVDAGLKGIETYSHGQYNGVGQKYRDIAQRYNLLYSGGTDFHVPRPDGRNAPGQLHIPYRVLECFKEAL